tara:strand:+ start:62 stop:214 length:153 start_codon:yes stop_codon:yes gene_type:complete
LIKIKSIENPNKIKSFFPYLKENFNSTSESRRPDYIDIQEPRTQRKKGNS